MKTVRVDIAPPNKDLIHAIADLVNSYARIEPGDPLKESVGAAIGSLLRPVAFIPETSG